MFCSKCGKQIKDGMKFCPFCGAQAASAQQTGAANNQPPQGAKQTAQQNPNVFKFEKHKDFIWLPYKTTYTTVNFSDKIISVEKETWITFIKRKPKTTEKAIKDISNVQYKTSVDVWDAIFTSLWVLFAIICLATGSFGTMLVWLAVAALYAWCAYGKVIDIFIKDGSKITIPTGKKDACDEFINYLNYRLSQNI